MIWLTCASNLLQDGDTNYFLVNSVSAKRKKDKQQSRLWVKTSLYGHLPELPQHLADKNESI